MRDLEANSIDVVVTSPPYNLKLTYGSYNDSREEDDYLDWLIEVCIGIKRVLVQGGSFFLNISGSSSRPWLPFELIVRLRSQFVLQNHISWVKSIGIGTQSRGHFKPISGQRFTHQNHEHIFHLTHKGDVALDRLSIGVPFTDKTNIARRNHARDLRCRGNTWFIPYETVNSHAKKFHHPAIYPIELPLWCVYLHGKPEMRVLDPFVGSGTSIIAAHYAGATGIGIDIDSNYIETAAERLREIVEMAMDCKLTETEISALMEQDPATAADGGFQSLLVGLQGKLNRQTGHISLTQSDIDRIRKCAFDYKNGGWQNRLVAIFGSCLGPNLTGK